MTVGIENSPIVRFLTCLHKIDRARITTRDVLTLYTIIARPGINGIEITHALGLQERSSLQFAFARLIRLGLIEDRREHAVQAVSAQFYITKAGQDLWDDIKP